MERLELNYSVFNKALLTLEEIIKEEYSIIVRDAAIQRFEYTFESFWKLIKIYLKVKEGISCNSPKSCFRELFSINLIDRNMTENLLEMTDMRNLTSHTYIEKIAEDIYNKILANYYNIMKEINIRLDSRGY